MSNTIIINQKYYSYALIINDLNFISSYLLNLSNDFSLITINNVPKLILIKLNLKPIQQ